MFNKVSSSQRILLNSNHTVEEKINALEAKINSFVTFNKELKGKLSKISLIEAQLESEGGSFKAIQTCQFKLPKIQKQILGNERKMVYLQNKLKQAVSIKKHADEYHQRTIVPLTKSAGSQNKSCTAIVKFVDRASFEKKFRFDKQSSSSKPIAIKMLNDEKNSTTIKLCQLLQRIENTNRMRPEDSLVIPISPLTPHFIFFWNQDMDANKNRSQDKTCKAIVKYVDRASFEKKFRFGNQSSSSKQLLKFNNNVIQQRQQAIPGFIRQVQQAMPQHIILDRQPLPQIPVLIDQVQQAIPIQKMQQAIPRSIRQVKIQKEEKKTPLTFWQSLNTNRTLKNVTYIASRSFAIHAATTLVVALLWPQNEDEKEAGSGGGGGPPFDPTGASFPSPAPYIPFTPSPFPELPKISNTPPVSNNPAPIQTIFTVSQIKKIANDYLESIGVPGAIISWFLYIIYSIIDKIKHHGKVLIEFAITRGKWGVPHIHTKWL